MNYPSHMLIVVNRITRALSLSRKSDKVTAFSHLVRRRSRRRSSAPSPSSGPPRLMRNKKSSKQNPPPPAVVQIPKSPSSPSSCPLASPSYVAVAPVSPGASSSKPPQSHLASNSKANALVSACETFKAIPPVSDLKLVTPLPASDKSDKAATFAKAKDPASTSSAAPSLAATQSEAPWLNLFKGSSRQLKKKGTAFTLPSGESCVKIPNSVIEKNRKSWDSFILGQFYSDPPAQGTIHAIVNGIWSRHHRDISVSKMEGNAYLFRIPNTATRNRVLSQGLWQIEGQTMFVAKWEPGPIPQKPELTSAPIWLELRQVPPQFFNEDGFEHIAGLVGDPKGLHPSTANMSNLEVAKVLTIIDPRKPLPEAVNVQFDSGEICRVLVSSPWMPPICSFCKEVGHCLKRCKVAPVTCSSCKSNSHVTLDCPRATAKRKKKTQIRKTIVEGVPGSDAALVGTSNQAKMVEGKEKVAGSVAGHLSPAPLVHAAKIHDSVAGSSQWIQVKPRSAKKKDAIAGVGSPSPDQNSISIDIGLEEIQASQALLEEKSLASDSSDAISTEGEPKQKKLLNAILPGWSFEDNYEFSDLGKIWILWHPSVKVAIISKSLQMVTCEVLLPDAQSEIIISFVYATNEDSSRRVLWDEIVTTSSNQRVKGKPWSVLGDFNQVLNPSDHSVSLSQNVDFPTRLFRECLLDADLADLTFRGCTYTWWNKRSVSPVAKKIDRILVNDLWSQVYPRSFGYFGEPDFSDHASCCITVNPSCQRQKRAFQFQNFLLKNQNFVPMISNLWFSFNFVGSAMYRFSRKLKALKNFIREFSKDNYSNLEKRVKEAHAVVIDLQSQLLSNPSSAVAHLESLANEKWQILLRAEEAFLLQRSRVTWLREGDLNSAYFHRMASTRQAINHIHFLVDAAGNRIESQKNIQDHCVEFYSNLLGNQDENSMFEPSDISNLLEFRCSQPQMDALDKQFTSEDIRAAVFSLPRNKTAGPDGFSAGFFRACWHIVGPEFVDAVLEFFRTGSILKQWNATTIILIPKIPNASSTSDFRPISLCNTVYKVISKLLAGRLQALLPHVISKAQSAFLKGRLLAENVLLASEIVEGYGRKNIGPRGMLKVDLRKAFDSVSWDFIIETMKAMHFPGKFIGWISQCISTPQFSVSVNGLSAGYFKSSRGLRQGDPISPYLFVLAMEVFSRLMSSCFSAGFIKFHPKTEELDISHLMFADDVMIFFDGSSSSLESISDTMGLFASWSGLKMNCEKTQLFVAGLDQNEASLFTNSGFASGSLPIRYLGLPLMSRKLRVSEFSPLIEKLINKFRSWAVSSLSYAGRLQLLNSVIYGLVNFWSSVFSLPKACIKKMESLCARFLWSGSIDSYHGAKVAWSDVCYPKREGGLGLRRIGIWNSTLCLKLIWSLFAGSGSLWVAWHHHHHIRGNSFWSLRESVRDSWNWKCLLRLRHLAEPFVRCNLGNGQLASFWFDSWLPLGPLIKFFGDEGPRDFGVPIQASVASVCDSQRWILPAPRSDQAVALRNHLLSIKLPLIQSKEDSYSWVIEGKCLQVFSTSKTWNVLRPRQSIKEWSASVWFKGATPKHAFTMWVSHLDRLPTRARLASWGLQIPSNCCLCSVFVESRDHLLLRCGFSAQIWHWLQVRLRLSPCIFYTWNALLAWTRLKTDSSPPILRKLAAQAVVYHIWKQRNNVLHNHVSRLPSAICNDIDQEVRNSITARRFRKQFRDLMILWIS
ncbi:Reverse transcriptase domain [Arabidopsis thaliana x Arabidopsis arenosa]|uniref:Reverse transcriptase domain n=1 Tax=Arabidopsis thaliana x Arabidopsis arenosa TaxID=1240361 RepID=A0A8T2BNA6_9BRAS|nr:Reverse transcriptase domain [Arabidopsis thaliana x Arabidopsis arenosa]